MESDNPQSATTTGSGQSVVVNLGAGFKHLAVVHACLIIVLVFSAALSIVAFEKAKNAEYQAAMYSYWAQRVEANMLARGMNVPAMPKDERK